jgi:hypothetical protein
MSGHGAYEDEMRLRRPYDTDDPEFSSLAEELRSACRGAPGPDVEARHIRAIVEQARLTPEAPIAEPNVVGRASKPVGVLARLGAAAAALAVLTGSLALAGVDLPVLPDRDSDTAGESREKTAEADAADGDENRGETALRVQAAIESNVPLLQAGDISGCEFGAIVSAAGRGVEPDTSKCNGENAAEGDDAEPGPAQSETAQRVQAAIEVNLPLLHEGEISGCEFGAIVSAAARGVEPDTSNCDTATVKAEADEAVSEGAKQKGGSAAKSSAPKGSKTAGDSQGNKEGGGGDATGASEEPAAKANNKGNAKAKGKGTDEDKAPGLGKGNGAPPAGKPGGKFDGD